MCRCVTASRSGRVVSGRCLCVHRLGDFFFFGDNTAARPVPTRHAHSPAHVPSHTSLLLYSSTLARAVPRDAPRRRETAHVSPRMCACIAAREGGRRAPWRPRSRTGRSVRICSPLARLLARALDDALGHDFGALLLRDLERVAPHPTLARRSGGAREDDPSCSTPGAAGQSP